MTTVASGFTNALLWCTWTTCVYGQMTPHDSTKTYKADEVVVTATRSEISVKDAPSPTEVIGAVDIANTNGGTVADLLQLYSGAWFKEYGAGASLKTISLRGSAAEHVLVLMDGNRFTSFQNEQVDFNLLPLGNIERIEILHGGSSAFYGADALGGVVNIITRPASSSLHAKADGSVGSYGFQRYSALVQGGLGGVDIVSGYSNEAGRDDYPFTFHRTGSSDTSLARTHANYRKAELFLNGRLTTDELSALTFSVQEVNSDRGDPGAIYTPSDASLAQLNDRDVNASLTYRDIHLKGVEFSLNTGFQYSFETYVDPAYAIDSYYKNTFFTANPRAQITLSTQDRLIVGGDLAKGILDGNDFDSRIRRNQVSLYVSNEYATERDADFLDHLSLYQTVRYDEYSDVGSALTPKLGLNVRLVRTGDVRFRASVGQSYRAPSFNDLYYRYLGNPLLKSEHSNSLDFGVLTSPSFGGEHSLELTYFLITTRDRILYDPVLQMPVNIGKTSSQGFESSYRGRFLEGLIELNLNYTYTDARKKNSASPSDSTFDKRLTFIPQNLFKGSISVHLMPMTINLFRTFTGVRFTNEDNSQSLAAYSLTGANVNAVFPFGQFKTSIKVEVSNVFNVSYEGFPNYPMPGRTYRVEAGIEY